MRKLLTVLAIFVSFKMVAFIAILIYEHTPLQLIEFHERAMEDVEFNDIFYSIRDERDQNLNAEKEVLLVNTGSLRSDSIRSLLPFLLKNTSQYGPVAIGIDLIFKDQKDPATDSLLCAAFTSTPGLVLAQDPDIQHSGICSGVETGSIIFPGKSGETVRYYHDYNVKGHDTLLSFAMALARKAEGGVNLGNPLRYLKYSAKEAGYTDALENNGTYDAKTFPAIEATALLDDSDSKRIRELIKDKVVIIGHLGSDSLDNPYDLQDKHRVPTDHHLVNRTPSMPGAWIHANALNQILHKDDVREVDGWLHSLLNSLILILFLYIFYTIHHKFLMGKALNMLIIILSTIPIIYLLGCKMLDFGIHYKVGTLFLQIAVIEEFIDVAEGFMAWMEKKKKKS